MQLEAILAISRHAEAKAHLGDWQLAAQLTEERNSLLEKLITAGDQQMKQLRFREALMEIRGIDNRVLRLAEKQKDAVLKELDSLHRGKRAADAYAATQSGKP